MIRKHIIAMIFLFCCFKKTDGQTLFYGKTNNVLTEIDFSSSQTAGYEFLGMGAASIIYSGTGISDTKFPNVGYAGGSALAITGAMLLVFGKKEPSINYWKGMDGIRPDAYSVNADEYNEKALFNSESGLIEFYLTNKRIKK